MEKYYRLFIFALLPFLFSCATTKKTVYFQGIDESNFEAFKSSYEVKIMPGDNLYITVSTIDSEASEMYNTLSKSNNVNAETLDITGYLVDSEGNINFPGLGTVKLGGLTKTEAIRHMTELLSKFLIDPIVNIRIVNYKVTILGEVAKPGTYNIKEEKVTLLEALGMAGDMTIYGKRKNVLVCRDINGEKHFERIDMTSADVFNSPYFYLKQNDIVYVQPNKARSGSSAYNQNLSLGVSLLSLIVTIIAVAK